jgi:PhnO protein
MNHPVTVRKANPEDADSIFAFVCELEETVFEYGLFEQYYLQNIASTANRYMVAVDQENYVLGYISCHGQLLLHHLGKVYEIQEMIVHKNHRGKGIGQLLLQALKDSLQSENYQSLEVTTRVKRKDTQEFYRKNGFAQTHVKFTREPES